MLGNRATTIKQLNLLGYKDNEAIYLRAIKDSVARKIKASNKNQIPWKELEKLQQQNFNLYLVINGIGDTDKDIKFGKAIFYEHDNLEKNIQIKLWQKLNLPEPTFQIDTGGKSIHSYWVFERPIDIEQWKNLQADLLEFANADRSIKNPSRVMRLAGSIHQTTKQTAQIISNTGKRYSYEELKTIISPEKINDTSNSKINETEILSLTSNWSSSSSSPPNVCSIPLEKCLTKEHRDFIERGVSEGGRNSAGAALARDLIGTAQRLNYLGIQYDGNTLQLFEEFCSHCNPPIPTREAESIWKSALKSNPLPCLTDDAIANCVKAWEYSEKRMKISQILSHSKSLPNLENTNISGENTNISGENSNISGENGGAIGGENSKDIGEENSGAIGGGNGGGIGGGNGGKNFLLNQPNPDEVFKLEVLAYSDEQDLFKKLRLKGQICANYRISAKELEKLVDAIKGRKTTPKSKRHTGSEFLLLETEGIKWLIPGIIPGRGVTILGGDPGVGKTTIAYDMAASLLYKESFLEEEINKSGKVLFVSSDEQPCFAQDKLINRGYSFDEQWQFVTDWDINQKQEFEEYLEDFRPDFVMVDSFAAIHRDENFDENSSSAKSTVYWLESMANKYGCAILLIHHCTKDRDKKGVGKLRGSSAIAGACSAVLLLEGEGNIKSFSAAKIRGSEQFKWNIKLDSETGSWSVVNGQNNDDLETKNLSEKIVLLFESKYPTARLEVEEIRMEIGGQKNSIYKALDRLCKRGILVKRPSQNNRRFKVYGLPILNEQINEQNQTEVSTNVCTTFILKNKLDNTSEHTPPNTSVNNTCLISKTLTPSTFDILDVTVDVTVDKNLEEKGENGKNLIRQEIQTLDSTLEEQGGVCTKDQIQLEKYPEKTQEENNQNKEESMKKNSLNIETTIEDLCDFLETVSSCNNLTEIETGLEVIKEIIDTVTKDLTQEQMTIFTNKFKEKLVTDFSPEFNQLCKKMKLIE